MTSPTKSSVSSGVVPPRPTKLTPQQLGISPRNLSPLSPSPGSQSGGGGGAGGRFPANPPSPSSSKNFHGSGHDESSSSTSSSSLSVRGIIVAILKFLFICANVAFAIFASKVVFCSTFFASAPTHWLSEGLQQYLTQTQLELARLGGWGDRFFYCVKNF